MRLLFVENEDSFSWNVIDCLPVDRADIFVSPSRGATWDSAALEPFDAVVVGPGPTDPIRAGLVDLVREAARCSLPFLGICLGHQALGLAFGAELVRVPPTHGKTSRIHFGDARRFPHIRGCCEAMRYHSLALARVHSPLRVVARTEDDIPMGIEHERLPMAGLQFHPDSYATARGREMLCDFFEAHC